MRDGVRTCCRCVMVCALVVWLGMFLSISIVELAFKLTVIFASARIDGYLLSNMQYGSFR